MSRVAPGGMLYHVFNRGLPSTRLFRKDADFETFERIIEQAIDSRPMRILSYCLMPTHWHFVLWPENDGDLGAFMQRLTGSHARNWQIARGRIGYGHLYQGRYKSFTIECGEPLYEVVRYVEANARRAKLVRRAEDWRYGSLWRRTSGTRELRRMLSDWPSPRRRSWSHYVNQPPSAAELEAIRLCLKRGRPYGREAWVRDTVARLGLESTVRPHGRPRRQDT